MTGQAGTRQLGQDTRKQTGQDTSDFTDKKNIMTGHRHKTDRDRNERNTQSQIAAG